VIEVAGRGEFARRGGIVDVFPPSAALPVRIEFFGDEIDSLRAFDPTDQRSVDAVKTLTLLPATEFLLPPGGADEVRARLGRLASKLPERLALDLARFAGDADPERPDASPIAGRALAAGDAAEVWARLIAPSTGLDHLDAGTLLVLDEPGDLADAAEFLWRQAEERHKELVDQGELPRDWPTAYLPAIDWKRRLHGARTLELTWQSDAAEAEGMAYASKSLTSGDLFGWREPVLPPGRTERLVDGVEHWLAEGARVVLMSDQAPRLAELLSEAGHPVGIVGRVAEPPPAGAIALVDRSLNGGFEGGPDGLALITDRELFGSVRVRRPKAMRRVVPRDILERLTPGDLVVHIDHGIARYEQMLRRGEPGQERDYLELSFAGTDRIFVPVEQINRVSRYSGGERPALSKLGGTDWLRTKQRVRKAVADLADELLNLYAKREAAEGFPYTPDSPWQMEMEASFPYEETPDQLRAVVEVKVDMETRRPMDRLVVGDVGYGKTEVALRAAFKALQDGKQVAVLVPTTLLAQQHYATFADRFAGYPIRVEVLSRFLTAAQARKVVAGLASGEVDCVIGTHRLLADGVRFKDLGLLVVDEEQRFGVSHKEAIKKMQVGVDTLTLSATPIPRTLEMSLTGIRDLSLLNTPPADRRPILTYVGSYDERAVAEAIRRELLREGQVFFVHNRVRDIGLVATRLHELVPEARIAVAHGQMDEGSLEQVVLDFWDEQYDVLVCTTIIESGIDMPTVNTLVVDGADRLGLGQLHQLRGRVGRAGMRAYAYLFTPPDRVLTEAAYERLKTIGEATELGSGFRIAMRDLEIRGAGNLLGTGQSGHVAAVGYDLYCQMVNEAVAGLRGETPPTPLEIKLDLPVDAHLPDDYVPREDLRLEAYRRLSDVTADADVDAIRAEWQDRYGPIPEVAETLLSVATLRAECVRLGITDVSVTKGSGFGGPAWVAKATPVTLRTSAQMRLKRLVKGASWTESAKLVTLPLPRTTDLARTVATTLRELLPPEPAKS
jgi:transcription-repair coupling factor (superfamily II helicase)